jgi:hypothetical protein
MFILQLRVQFERFVNGRNFRATIFVEGRNFGLFVKIQGMKKLYLCTPRRNFEYLSN